MYGENMIRIKYTKYTTVDDKDIPDDIIDKFKKLYKDEGIDESEMISCYLLSDDLSNWMICDMYNEKVEDEYFEEISYVED
jgi:hypothetical protein